MLVVMKNLIINSLLLFALISAYSANAALYRGLDAEGNVVYSDTPFEDAEQFTPPPISVVDTPKVGSEKKPVEEKPKEFKYTQFDIVSPSNKQTIRNEPDLSVSITLKPGLNAEKGHKIWLLLDEKPFIKDSQQLSFNLGRLNRGAHKLQAQVRDYEGKVILRTRVTVIFVHQTAQ